MYTNWQSKHWGLALKLTFASHLIPKQRIPPEAKQRNASFIRPISELIKSAKITSLSP